MRLEVPSDRHGSSAFAASSEIFEKKTALGRRVTVQDARIEGSDDALCFKTIRNGGLAAYPSSAVTVRRSSIGSTWCNAIQFGSATELDMTGFAFEDIEISSARKSAERGSLPFPPVARRAPTANADGLRRPERIRPRGPSRPFRCHRRIRGSPRRAPSACSEREKKGPALAPSASCPWTARTSRT